MSHLAVADQKGAAAMAIIAILGVAAASFVLRCTVFGQLLSAVGQNRAAARLAAIRNGRVIAAAFIISSVLASLDGLLLGAYIGGAFLEMGQPYLLQSIAAVVLGGTLIFGGSATALGTLFASILLILIVTTMRISAGSHRSRPCARCSTAVRSARPSSGARPPRSALCSPASCSS